MASGTPVINSILTSYPILLCILDSTTALDASMFIACTRTNAILGPAVISRYTDISREFYGVSDWTDAMVAEGNVPVAVGSDLSKLQHAIDNPLTSWHTRPQTFKLWLFAVSLEWREIVAIREAGAVDRELPSNSSLYITSSGRIAICTEHIEKQEPCLEGWIPKSYDVLGEYHDSCKSPKYDNFAAFTAAETGVLTPPRVGTVEYELSGEQFPPNRSDVRSIPGGSGWHEVRSTPGGYITYVTTRVSGADNHLRLSRFRGTDWGHTRGFLRGMLAVCDSPVLADCQHATGNMFMMKYYNFRTRKLAMTDLESRESINSFPRVKVIKLRNSGEDVNMDMGCNEILIRAQCRFVVDGCQHYRDVDLAFNNLW